MDVLGLVKPAEIPGIIRLLNPLKLDILMKFIYRGQMNPESFNAGVLLAWHERVLEVAGLGSIVRGLTDRMIV
jgi:actin related protein 2/3 complex, subunit 5